MFTVLFGEVLKYWIENVSIVLNGRGKIKFILPYQIYTSFKYTTFGEFVKGYYSHFRYEHWNALLTIVIIPIAKMRDIMSIADSRYPANHAPWVFSYSSWTHICVSYNMRKSKCMVMAKEIDWENDAFQSTCCISILNVLLIPIIYNFAKK